MTKYLTVHCGKVTTHATARGALANARALASIGARATILSVGGAVVGHVDGATNWDTILETRLRETTTPIDLIA